MITKNKIILALILVILISLIRNVDAVGVTPARKIIDFEPNLKLSNSFNVVNNDEKDLKVVVYLEGDLKNYVKLSQTELQFTSEESSKSVGYEVNLPEKIQEPGTHEVNVIVSEVNPSIEGEEVYSIGVKSEVVHQIHIRVPYPGKYIKADLYSIDEEDGIKFIISMINLGSEKINNAKATIDIYSGLTKIKSFETNEKGLSVRERGELITGWEIYNASSGNYDVKATVYYDGNKLELGSKFTLGDFLIRLLDIFVNNFRLGGIAKFNILVQSMGNEEVGGLYSEMDINRDGQDVNDLKSAEIDVKTGETNKLFVFWDTEGIDIGLYDGKLMLKYDDKVMEKQIRMIVKEDGIDVEIVGVTGAVVGGTNIKTSANILLIVIVIGGGVFLYWKLRKRKEYK